MPEYLEHKSLAEKQMHYYNAFLCPYCDKQTELIDSIKVYKESYGLMYRCTDCNAHVGVHKGTDQSLGPLAKKDLRDLRIEAHRWFNPLWEKKIAEGFSKTQARRKAYKWLASVLNVSSEEAHVGYCSISQCNLIISECKKYFKGTVENVKVVSEFTYTKEEKILIDIIEFNAGYLGFSFTKKGNYEYFLSHTDGIFSFNIKTKKGWWSFSDVKWKLIPDLEKYIIKNFKNKP